MRKHLDVDPITAEALRLLQDQPSRDPEKERAGRAAFLAQAEAMVSSGNLLVSHQPDLRHNRWMRIFQTIFTGDRKEQTPMMQAVSTFLLVIVLALAGGGVTVAAAQQSMPDQGLYPVKVWIEDIRVQQTTQEQQRLQLALDYANRRVEEMGGMLRAGQVPPQAVQDRLQTQLDLALRLAAGMPGDPAQQALLQIRTQLREHEQAFSQLPAGDQTPEGATVLRVRSMLRERLQWCDEGLRDPETLQERLRTQDQNRAPAVQPGDRPTATPARPGLTGTPAQMNRFGPGPAAPSSEPAEIHTPAPNSGSGYGPGGGSGGEQRWTVTPSGSQNSYGPGPQNGTAQPRDQTGSGGAGQENGGGGGNSEGGSGPGPGGSSGGGGAGGEQGGAGGNGSGGGGGKP